MKIYSEQKGDGRIYQNPNKQKGMYTMKYPSQAQHPDTVLILAPLTDIIVFSNTIGDLVAISWLATGSQ